MSGNAPKSRRNPRHAAQLIAEVDSSNTSRTRQYMLLPYKAYACLSRSTVSPYVCPHVTPYVCPHVYPRVCSHVGPCVCPYVCPHVCLSV